ncbi:immunoglobulin domain-containing protein [Sinomicrobium oceani]|uniref:immunoglobulin domain-containing protein n=1 Tax=Sinomicrobium oceani TaxID=1150368 RepID=UPI00227A1D70|nr:hypothetical protein [Sinomicrobium oceani]
MGGVNIYGAYFSEPGDNVDCNTASDILWGSEASLAGGVNAVDDPQNAIDGDTSTYAELHATVSVLGKTHITALYPITSIAGDSVRVVFQNPGGLLNLDLLSSALTIRTFLDNEDNGILDLDANVLKLSLLPGDSDVQIITYPVNVLFNRIQVAIGEGVATALGALRVYDLSSIMKSPEVTSPQFVDDVAYACYGNPVTLNIASPLANSIYRWYTVAAGGTSVFTGTSYAPDTTIAGTRFFYVSEMRNGCTDETGRTPVKLVVLPSYGNPDIAIEHTTN